MNSSDPQVFTFVFTILMGIAIGFLFDLLRVWRWLVRPKGMAAYLGDVLFAVVAGFVILVGLLLVNWVQIRGFVVIGLALGGSAYFYSAGPLVRRLFIRLSALMAGLGWGVYKASRLVCGKASARTLPFISRMGRRVRSPVRRVRGWGREFPRRVAGWWRRLPGFLS